MIYVVVSAFITDIIQNRFFSPSCSIVLPSLHRKTVSNALWTEISDNQWCFWNLPFAKLLKHHRPVQRVLEAKCSNFQKYCYYNYRSTVSHGASTVWSIFRHRCWCCLLFCDTWHNYIKFITRFIPFSNLNSVSSLHVRDNHQNICIFASKSTARGKFVCVFDWVCGWMCVCLCVFDRSWYELLSFVCAHCHFGWHDRLPSKLEFSHCCHFICKLRESMNFTWYRTIRPTISHIQYTIVRPRTDNIRQTLWAWRTQLSRAAA